MNKLIITFVFFICTHLVISQTVASSCSASNSIIALYIRDADRLALRKIYAQNLTYTDSIIIPQTHTDTVLKALIAVYNATNLPARNTVISQYNIHSFPIPNVNHLLVAADSNLTWMHQLKLGNIPTGNTQVDSLISEYDLTRQSYTNYYGLFPYHVVTLTSDSSYNLPPLADLLENISGVYISEPASVIGGGNDISASIYPNYVQLVYSIGWEDCPSSCIYRHYWEFNVYYDCSVQYIGEYGTAMPAIPAPTISVSGVYCTNETLTVTISGANSSSLNNQPTAASQFTLSSLTPTSYVISASNYSYPASPATSSISISITDCSTLVTSINENQSYSNISIYPNPANEFIELVMKGGSLMTQKAHFYIYNHIGQLVKEGEFIFNERAIKIKIEDLENGVYVLGLSSAHGQSNSFFNVNKRFLISR